MSEGVTTIEIKSGYGLSEVHEARCLAVARRLGRELPLTVRTSSLAAHALPPEYAGRADDYITDACRWMAGQQAQGLVDAIDAYCDTIVFTPAQNERVFQDAHRLALPVKLHAEQFSDQGGAALSARHVALSCDHLEHLFGQQRRSDARRRHGGYAAARRLLPSCAIRTCLTVAALRAACTAGWSTPVTTSLATHPGLKHAA